MKKNTIEKEIDDIESLRKSSFSPKHIPFLCHYTNMTSLLQILSTKKFKFSRIDYVNDLTEKMNLSKNKNYERVFISCFTEQEESIPMWKIYTQNNLGVMLKLFFKPKASAISLFKNDTIYTSYNSTIPLVERHTIINNIGANLDSFKVEYSSICKKTTVKLKNNEMCDYTYYFARSKTTAWDFEKEYRYRIILHTGEMFNNKTKSNKELYANINFDCLDKIQIIFNPWTSKKSWENIISPFIDNYNKNFFELQDSAFANKIKL